MLHEIDCAYCLHRHEVTGRHVVAFSGSRAKFWHEQPIRLVDRCIVRFRDVWGADRLVVKVGDATGIDELVREACSGYGICYEVLRADWKHLGSAAGHERNGRVLDGADELVAISRPGQFPSTGTGDAIYQAGQRGVRVYEWRGRWQVGP